MAKKKKQKKGGIEKRRKTKQQKRSASKKRLIAQQPVQKKISPAKLKQSLKNIPSLIFEPELQEIAFTGEQIKEVLTQHEKVPDQIAALATAEFIENLKLRHETMKTRFEQQGDTNKTMMAHAIIYFMEQENAPPFLNQIIVAMYFNALHLIDHEEPLTLKELNEQLREYDKEWEEYLKENADLMAAVDAAEQTVIDESTEDEANGSVLEPSLFEGVVGEFGSYLEAEQSFDEEQRERMQEDVEVLVNDYFEEKGITELESIRSRKVKTFLESWFINTMHPTKEDLETMIESLNAFFSFTIEKEILSPEKGKEILDLLQDKEMFLSNLNI